MGGARLRCLQRDPSLSGPLPTKRLSPRSYGADLQTCGPLTWVVAYVATSDASVLFLTGHGISSRQSRVSAMPQTSADRLQARPLTTPPVCRFWSQAPMRTLAVPVSEEIVDTRVSWIDGPCDRPWKTCATVVNQWMSLP